MFSLPKRPEGGSSSSKGVPPKPSAKESGVKPPIRKSLPPRPSLKKREAQGGSAPSPDAKKFKSGVLVTEAAPGATDSHTIDSTCTLSSVDKSKEKAVELVAGQETAMITSQSLLPSSELEPIPPTEQAPSSTPTWFSDLSLETVGPATLVRDLLVNGRPPVVANSLRELPFEDFKKRLLSSALLASWMAAEASCRLEASSGRLNETLENEATARVRIVELEAALQQAFEEKAEVERDREAERVKTRVAEEKSRAALLKVEEGETHLGEALKRAETAEEKLGEVERSSQERVKGAISEFKESEEGQRWRDENNAAEIWGAVEEVMSYANQATDGTIDWSGCRWYSEEAGGDEEKTADQEETTHVDQASTEN